MHISFAVFADAANVSQEGKLNVLGIFDALHVSAVPTIHPRAHLVVRLKGTHTDVGSHAITFRWVGPNGTELWSSAGEMQLEAGGPVPVPAAAAAGLEIDLPVIAVVDLPLESVGRHTMQVELDGAAVTRVPLHVTGPIASAAPLGGLVS